MPPGPSYGRDIAPLLDRDCNTCHAPGAAVWPLVGYENVRAWSDLILLDVQQCKMPPLDAGVTLSSADRAMLLDWLACGAIDN